MAIPAKKFRFWLGDKVEDFVHWLIKDKKNPQNPSIFYDAWMMIFATFLLVISQLSALLRLDATEDEKEAMSKKRDLKRSQ